MKDLTSLLLASLIMLACALPCLGVGLLAFWLLVHTGMFDPWFLLSALDDRWPWVSHFLDGILAMPTDMATGPVRFTTLHWVLFVVIVAFTASLVSEVLMQWFQTEAVEAPPVPDVLTPGQVLAQAQQREARELAWFQAACMDDAAAEATARRALIVFPRWSARCPRSPASATPPDVQE